MALTDLLVKAQFNLSTQLLTLTDLIAGAYNTTHGLTLANIQGIFRVSGATAGVIYQNVGWGDGEIDDDYSSPDINGATPDWVKDAISLPLDSNNLVLQDIYTVEYRITSDGTGDTTFTFSKTYTHLYVTPTAVLTDNINIPKSYATITDSTTYAVLINSVYYSPTSTTRVLSVTWPSGSGEGPSVTSTTSLTLGPNLWTGDYILGLNTIVYYTPPSDTGLTIEIYDVVIGVGAIEVETNDVLDAVEVCLTSMTALYEQYKISNLPLAQVTKVNLDNMYYYYNMYQLAVETSKDTTYAATNLRTLMAQNGCDCCSSSTTSRELSPQTSGTNNKDEFIVTNPLGQTEFTLSFNLNTNSLVLVEGIALLNNQISGFGTSTLTISYTVTIGQTVIVQENS